jgi:hypothetical protein
LRLKDPESPPPARLFFGACFGWLFGYAFSMLAKKALALALALEMPNQVSKWLGTGGPAERLSLVLRVFLRIGNASWTRLAVAALLLAAALVLLKKFFKAAGAAKDVHGLLLCAVPPFLWVFVLQEHARRHFCTQFNYCIPLFCLLYVVLARIDFRRLGGKLWKTNRPNVSLR